VSSELRGTWSDGWYVVPHQVLFRDLDPYSHVNNAVFLSYFEMGRALLWFDVTGRRGARDLDFIVARAEVDYKQQLGLEPIEICTSIGEIRNTSFDWLHEIRKGSRSEVVATGRVVCVLYDWARGSKKSIDDDLRRKLTACSPQRS
jgi:acyl-CoA thioester hydrolase